MIEKISKRIPENLKIIFRPIVIPIFQKIYRWKEKMKLIGRYIPKIQYRVTPSPKFMGNEFYGFAVDERRVPKNGGVFYCFGVGKEISFDRELLRRFPGADLYAFDPTPESIEWIEKEGTPDNFHFFPVGISDMDGLEKFYLPKDNRSISGSTTMRKELEEDHILVEMKKLSTIMKDLGHERIHILKMDIEGSEFDVVPQILKEGIKFDQLCIELHNRFYKHGNKKAKDFIHMLNEKGYYITFVSEFKDVLTFERKMRRSQ